MAHKFDIAIVGLGPTGAVLSLLLAQAGLKVYACDRLPGVHEIPRALAMDHEIMRVFQQLGLSETIAPFCEPFTPSEYYGVSGQLIKRMTMVAPPYPMGHVPSMVFNQPSLERALREHMGRFPGITVALQTEMLTCQSSSDRVTARLRGPQGQEVEIQAKWLIGCDGGSSTVRALAGIALQDLDFDEPWLVVDVLVNDQGLAKLPKVSVQYCEPERPSTLVIGPGRHRRWEISLKEGEDPQRMATPECTWELLSRWITPQDGQLWRQSSYRFHALVAQQWRQGRVFLAGDSAHMQPPFLGQGMCQGIRDATNLAWKLIAMSRHPFNHEKSEAILDSYTTERKAHVMALTSRIKKIGEVICERDLHLAMQRDAQMLADCAGVVPDTPRQDLMPALTSGMLSDTPHTGRGLLFPQPRLLHPDVLMDDLMGHGWRWVTDGTWALPDSTSGWTVCDLSDRCAEREGVVRSWLALHQGHAALIRPDHHVFGVATSVKQVQDLRNEWLHWMPTPH